MEAVERREQRSLRWHLRHPFATRWTRVPLFFFGALGVTVLVALALRSNWVECRNLQEWYDKTCPTVPRQTIVARFVGVLGVITLILGPVTNALYRLFRYGQAWETTRHETIVSNIPIVAGLTYLALGFLISIL